MDETPNSPLANQLATEHVCVDDIGTQLINIESVLQTIREQVSGLESGGMETSALELKSLFPKLDVLQTSLRKTFDAHARPLIRDLHVLELPEELLRRIFQHVADRFMTSDRHGTVAVHNFRSIMRCRLVCRQFCESSSHLLLYKLEVSMTKSSLAHLDEVSRHPTISQGVKSLHIGIGFFDSFTASSLRKFADYGVQVVRICRHIWEATLQMTHLPQLQILRETRSLLESDPRLPEATCGMVLMGMNLPERIERCSQILDSWNKYIRAEISEHDQDEFMVALRQSYERYNQLLSDQQALLQDNTFFRSITTAVARMPTIAGLRIVDGPLGTSLLRRGPGGPDTTDESVQEALLKPGSWYRDSFERFGQPPVDFLFQLPLAVGRAGSSLTMLHITFTPAVDVKLNFSEEEVRDVVKAAQNLRVLSISCNSLSMAPQANHASEKWTHLSKLMSLFLEAPKLSEVSLEFSDLNRKGQLSNNASLGPLITLLPWTKLRKVALVRVPVHFHELAACLEQLEPEAFIELERVRLRTGTWADLLDLLRTKANCSSDVHSPRGGEDKESDPEWHKKFRSVDGQGSLAVQYIRGLPLRNPLRQHNDGSDTDEAGEVQL